MARTVVETVRAVFSVAGKPRGTARSVSPGRSDLKHCALWRPRDARTPLVYLLLCLLPPA